MFNKSLNICMWSEVMYGFDIFFQLWSSTRFRTSPKKKEERNEKGNYKS